MQTSNRHLQYYVIFIHKMCHQGECFTVELTCTAVLKCWVWSTTMVLRSQKRSTAKIWESRRKITLFRRTNLQKFLQNPVGKSLWIPHTQPTLSLNCWPSGRHYRALCTKTPDTRTGPPPPPPGHIPSEQHITHSVLDICTHLNKPSSVFSTYAHSQFCLDIFSFSLIQKRLL